MNDDICYINKLYRRIWKSDRINDLDLPRSDVFFVQRGIKERYDEDYSLEHIRVSMWLEGHLPVKDIRKIPQWYIDKYMGGKCNFEAVKRQVRYRRQQRLQEAAACISEESKQN